MKSRKKKKGGRKREKLIAQGKRKRGALNIPPEAFHPDSVAARERARAGGKNSEKKEAEASASLLSNRAL